MSATIGVVEAFPATRAGRSAACIEDELGRLMGDYESSLLLFTWSLVEDTDLARDCVQDTFLRAYQALCGGREINKQWLWKVARNRVMDEFRHRRRLRPESNDLTAAPFDASSETSIMIGQAMDRLPRHHREVLYLFAVAGFKTDEIAGLLDTSGPAVRQQLYRARQQFRRVYGREDYCDI